MQSQRMHETSNQQQQAQQLGSITPQIIKPTVPNVQEATKISKSNIESKSNSQNTVSLSPQPVDRFGFMSSDSRFQNSSGRDGLKKQDVWLENCRTSKWIRMAGPQMEHWEAIVRGPKLKSRVRKGIPDALRGRVWRKLTTSCSMMKNNPGVYHSYIHDTNGPSFDVIARDIGRTFPKHDMFSAANPLGQASLTNVLRAYSLHDPEVGYCQGMGFIAAMFLSYMPEEEAFWQMVACMTSKKYSLASVFRPGMAKVAETMFVFEALLEKYLPAVKLHFDNEGLHPTMYASQWFITLYTYSFPFDLVTRIWDIFLHEGWKIIYRIALALLKQKQSQLLALDFESSMDFFHALPSQADPDQLLRVAFSIPLTTKEVDIITVEANSTSKKGNK